MPTLRYAMGAVERLASFIDTNLPTKLAQIETELGLSSGDLGRPINPCIRADVATDPRDNLVEVYDLRSAPENLRDTTIFRHQIAVAITLFSADGTTETVELRLREWQTAWWSMFTRGTSTLSGTVNGALCHEFSRAAARLPQGTQIATGLALVDILQQETTT